VPAGEQGSVGDDQLHFYRNPVCCCLPGHAFNEGIGHDLAPAPRIP
jgi:hypothetical protein